ncbi:MAG: ADP-ribosylglycohydrolase family protein [Desulfuromonadaceae bacterium]|nr:ADP-ribosylglycohydrolase family protein [Desulfuromonadaceae bacterium]
MSERDYTTTPKPSIADRIRGAVWGQFVGDAFCLGSHWIYDLGELEKHFPGGPRGFEEPAAGHYHAGKRPGDLTHYGDGALLLLRSLQEQTRFDASDFGSRFVSLIGSPGYIGYRDHAAKDTVANYRAYRELHPDGAYGYQDGADDDQPASITRLAPLVARYFKDSDLVGIVERATRVCQNNERAVAYNLTHAMILQKLFNGSTLDDAVSHSAEQASRLGAEGVVLAGKIAAAIAGRNLSVREATLKFGQSCPLAGSFPAALQCALHYADDFGEALRATAAVGGDNAARGAMIGSWLGASLGVQALSDGWYESLTAREEIASGVEWLVRMADS